MEIEIQEYGSLDIQLDQSPQNPDIGRYIELQPLGEGQYKLSNKGYVGAIQLTEKCIIYSIPKVGISNVLRMFNYAEKTSIDIKRLGTSFKEERNFLDLLSRMYIQEVEWLCKTAYRRFYETRTDALSHIHGKILVKETLTRNLFVPRVSCEFSEFTDDILDNRILKYAAYLQMIAISASEGKGDLLRRLRQLYSYFDSVTLETLTVEDLKQCRYDRLNECYRKSHQISQMFVEYLYTSHRPGKRRFFCFMIDMDRLFENFVRGLLSLYNDGFSVERGSHILDTIKNRVVIVRPDIVISKEGDVKLIVDCKYKRLSKLEDDNGLERSKPLPSDIYQMLAYLVAYKCPRGIIIYPSGEANDTEIAISVESEVYTIKIRQIDLMRLEKDYLKSFAEELQKEIIS